MEGYSKAESSEMLRMTLDTMSLQTETYNNLSATFETPILVPPASLDCLPFEIRLKIYYYCIPTKQVIVVSYPRFYAGWIHDYVDHTLDFEDALNFEEDTAVLDSEADTVCSERRLELESDYWTRDKRNQNTIFLLSKQISEEVLNILYGENIFAVDLHGRGEHDLKENFAAANIERMRYLLLAAQPRGFSYEPGIMPDDVLWSSVLPKVNGLRIVAAQPVHDPSILDNPAFLLEMDRWANWIKPYLQIFGQYLSKDSIVQVDINGQEETRELVKECLPCGYREIRCRHYGDMVFKRGRFSLKSAYSGFVWEPDGQCCDDSD